VVRFPNLERFLNVLERKVNGFINVLLRYPREPLKPSARKPFRDPFNCDGKRRELLWKEPLWLELIRMGKTSTKNAPGFRATSTAANASSDAEKNLSLSDSTFTPYATDKAKDPVRLPNQKECDESKIMQGLSRADAQMRMLQEALGRFG
jgi:hypothetical protein